MAYPHVKNLSEFRDTKKKAQLIDAQRIAAEWVTLKRLQHVIPKTTDLSINYELGPEHTAIIVSAMIEEVISEGVGQIENSPQLRMAIAKRTDQLYNSWLYNFRGIEFLKNKRYREAAEHFTLAISIDDHFYPAYLNRGCAYYEMGEYYLFIQDFGISISNLTSDEIAKSLHVIDMCPPFCYKIGEDAWILNRKGSFDRLISKADLPLS